MTKRPGEGEPQHENKEGLLNQYHDLWELFRTAIKAKQQELLKDDYEEEDVEVSIDVDPLAFFIQGRMMYAMYRTVERLTVPKDCNLQILKDEINEWIKENETYFNQKNK